MSTRYRLAWLSARRRASFAQKAFYAEARAARELEDAVREMKPAPVANRERVAEVLARTLHMFDSNPKQWNELDPVEQEQYHDDARGLAIALFTSSGVFRDEAEVKAEALDQAAEQIIIPGASSLAAAWLQGRATRLRGESRG